VQVPPDRRLSVFVIEGTLPLLLPHENRARTLDPVKQLRHESATAARLMKPFSWFDEVIQKRTSARFALSRRRAMFEFVAAAGVLFSISIFVAHAFDAYRTR
jgi:hypothetical protein